MPDRLGRTFEGFSILEELPSAYAVWVFTRYRDVHLWAITDPAIRHLLFSEEPSSQIALVEGHGLPGRSCRLLEAVHSDPGGASALDLSDACGRLSEWATGNGFLLTALLFTEVAARLVPDSPERSYRAALKARAAGLPDRGVHWLQHTLGVARRINHPAAATDALLSWGTLEVGRGNLQLARRRFLQGWKAARRAHLRALAVAAQHNLMILSAELGEYERANRHGWLALRSLRTADLRAPSLIHDVSFLWTRQQFFAPAAKVLTATLKLYEIPAIRHPVLTVLGMAAAALGDAALFFRAWNDASALSGVPSTARASGLVCLSLGAQYLRLIPQAFELAEMSLQVARSGNHRYEEDEARRILTDLRNGVSLPPARQAPYEVTAAAEEIIARFGEHSVAEVVGPVDQCPVPVQ